MAPVRLPRGRLPKDDSGDVRVATGEATPPPIATATPTFVPSTEQGMVSNARHENR